MAGGPVQVSVPECAVAMPGTMARPGPLLSIRRVVPSSALLAGQPPGPVRHPYTALRGMSEQK